MKRIGVLCFLLAAVFAITAVNASQAYAENPAEGSGSIEFSAPYTNEYWGNGRTQETVRVTLHGCEAEDVINLTSSDPFVVSVGLDHYDPWYYDGDKTFYVRLTYHRPGKAVITAEWNGEKAEYPCFIHPECPEITKISAAGYKKVKLEWTRANGAEGYLITRYKEYPSNYIDTVIATVRDPNTTSIKLKAATGVEYTYRITTCFFLDGEPIINQYRWSSEKQFACPLPETEVESIKVSKGSMLLRWKPASGAVGYEIYRSSYEEDGYKKIGKVSGGTLSFTDRPKTGTVWYYGVKPVFSDAKGRMVDIYAQMIPGKNPKKKSYVNHKKIKLWNDVYNGTMCPALYHAGSSLYFAAGEIKRQKIIMKIYRLKDSYKVKSTKTVTIPLKKGGEYKGFYHGPDGNNYIVVTYPNFSDKKTRTVMQVFRYSSKWKKTGTASLKAKGAIYGIGGAVVIGEPAIKMQGNNLVIHTSRYHFINKNDGLRHESNLTVFVDLKRMKARYDDPGSAYASHSFNQRLRIRGGRIYFADLGDAYPRGIQLCMGDSALPRDSWGSLTGIDSYVPFKFRGATGRNYTGTSLRGMETGKNNIVIAGVSVPHNHAVKGIKGFENRYGNLYANIIDRKTGKARVVWLTRYNPKKSGPDWGSCNLVKLSDNRFVVLVSINERLHYYLINEKGQTIKHIKFKKSFKYNPLTEPVVHNGNIVWPAAVWPSDDSDKGYVRMCIIPIVS